MKNIYLLSLSIMAVLALHSQNVLLVEHFDYPAGAEIRDFGWTPHSAGSTNPLLVTDGGLAWSQTPYAGSSVGNACAVNNTGSDENKPFSSSVTSGPVYASFLMRVPEAVTGSNAGFFFHLGQYSNISNPDLASISTAFRARTYKAPGSDATKFRVGLNFNAAAVPTDPANLTAELNINETYLVVVKYEVVEGPDNDLVSLYVFADGDDVSTEPAMADIGPLGGSAADLSAVQLVALRQYEAGQNVVVDGIIVQDTWNLLAPPPPPFTGPVLTSPANGTTLVVEGDPSAQVVINWGEAQNAPGPVTYEWQLALRDPGNFDSPLAQIESDNAGSSTSLTLTIGALDALLMSLGVAPGTTVEAIWRVRAQSEGETVFSVDTFDIDITRGVVSSTSANVLSKEMTVYPNPARQTAFLRFGNLPAGTLNLRMVNGLGQTVRSFSTPAQSNQQLELPVLGIPSGMYFIVISIDDMQGVQRLVIE